MKPLDVKEFFEIVEFSCFSTEYEFFSYISWYRVAADRSRKMALGEIALLL